MIIYNLFNNWETQSCALYIVILIFIDPVKSFKDSVDLSKDYSRYMNGNESDLLVFYPMNELHFVFLILPIAVLFSNYLQYIKKNALREFWLWAIIAMGFFIPLAKDYF